MPIKRSSAKALLDALGDRDKITAKEYRELFVSGKARTKSSGTARERQLADKVDQLQRTLKLLRLLLDRFEAPVRVEYAFLPKRRYRADLAIMNGILGDRGVIIEIDGGAWQGRGHFSKSGGESDRKRDSLALVNGWDTIRRLTDFDPEEIMSVIDELEKRDGG